VSNENEREFALTAAAQAFCNRGVTIACPWEGDLDDREREIFDALVAAIDSYNTIMARASEPAPSSPVPVEAVRPSFGGLAAGWEIMTVYRGGYGCSWVTDLAGLATEIDRLLSTDGALIWSVTPVGLLRSALPAAPAHREVGE
jgi:hypothetical protein